MYKEDLIEWNKIRVIFSILKVPVIANLTSPYFIKEGHTNGTVSNNELFTELG